MMQETHLAIAGFRFVITHEPSLPPLFFPNRSYRDFLNPSQDNRSEVRIPVRLLLDRFPEMEDRYKVFDSNEAWNLYRIGKHLYVEFAPRDFHEPLWVARTDEGISEVTVWCSSQLIQQGKGKQLFHSPMAYPLDQILLIHLLGRQSGCLIHGAGAIRKDRGFLFAGRSGAGKSTITELIGTQGRFQMLSDDRIAIRRKGNRLILYGTPWPGEAGVAQNRSAALAGIFFLSHSEENRIVPISAKDAMAELLPVAAIPWHDAEVFTPILQFLESLIAEIPVYELFFKPSPEIADVLEKFVSD